jgi:hypothetical protein
LLFVGLMGAEVCREAPSADAREVLDRVLRGAIYVEPSMSASPEGIDLARHRVVLESVDLRVPPRSDGHPDLPRVA